MPPDVLAGGLPGHPADRSPAMHPLHSHRHSYWVGSKKDAANRRKVLKWVPPVLAGKNGAKIQKDVKISAVEWKIAQ